MKKLVKVFMVFMVAFFALTFLGPILAFAQEAVSSTPPVSDVDLLQQIIGLISGYKGMSSLAIAAGAVQLVIMFLSSPICGKLFTKLDSQMKLIVVTGLSIVLGFISAKVAGIPLGEAALSAANVAAIQVFLHQIYLKFYANKPAAV